MSLKLFGELIIGNPENSNNFTLSTDSDSDNVHYLNFKSNNETLVQITSNPPTPTPTPTPEPVVLPDIVCTNIVSGTTFGNTITFVTKNIENVQCVGYESSSTKQYMNWHSVLDSAGNSVTSALTFVSATFKDGTPDPLAVGSASSGNYFYNTPYGPVGTNTSEVTFVFTVPNGIQGTYTLKLDVDNDDPETLNGTFGQNGELNNSYEFTINT